MKTRSFAKNFTINVDGKISTTGRLLSIRATKDHLKLCTPDYGRVRKVYLDEDGNIWEEWQLSRAIEVSKDLPLQPAADKKEIDKARESLLPKNILEFSVFKEEDVNEHTFQTEGQGFLFQVTRNNKGVANSLQMQNYKAIVALLQTPGVALVGKANVQNHEGLYRAGLYKGQLYIQKQLYPEDLNEFEDLDDLGDMDDIVRKMSDVAPRLMKTFDPDDYRDDVAQRLQTLVTDGVVEEVEVSFDTILESLVGAV